MKKAIFFVICILCSLGLTACSDYEASISTNCVTIEEDNTVKAIIIEEFDKDYYSESELLDMVNQEAQDFNNKYGVGTMSISDHQLTDGVITLALDFGSIEAYNNYMPDSVFIGSVREAYDQGMDFNRSLWVVGKGESTIGKNNLLNMGDEKLIVVNGAYTVRTPSNIKYYSQGMYILDANTVMSTEDGIYFIIYK